ncbi:MAG: SH3 domain-containing protein [Candidatus Zixiibacteriota bacterium]
MAESEVKKRLVKSAHTATYTDPLIVSENEIVEVGRRDSEYQGWLWCTAKSGKSGWVPEKYLEWKGDKGIMSRDYDATELTVDVGECVTVLFEESGWVWCLASDGRAGWLPIDRLS